MVPSLLAVTWSPDTVGAPLVVNGGHAPAHSSKQAGVGVSEANMYSARPDWSVRKVPMVPLWASTVARPLGPAAPPSAAQR